jgi:hypothetical protein
MWNYRRGRGGRGIARLRQRSKANLARVKPVDRLDEVFQTPRPNLFKLYDQRIPDAHMVKAGVQLRTMVQRAEPTSRNTRLQPAALRASSCRSRFCSSVDARA